VNDRAIGSGLGSGDDLSALAWVHDELRRSLETAHKALRRHVREAEAVGASDVDTVDPAVLRGARMAIHQSAGALELVGLTEVADVLRASENLVNRLSQRPQLLDMGAVETVERLSFAVLDYVGRLLVGKAVSPVMLFPQYRAAQQLAGADRVHPADLWRMDFQWRELPDDGLAAPRAADDDARGAMEGLTLGLMRQPDAATQRRMSDLCAGLGAGARGAAHTLWQLAAAVFEGQAAGALATDVFTKRLASRLLTQLRMAVRGQEEVSERLALDLLFFCAHAKEQASVPMPRLEAVRQAWRLKPGADVDYETPRLGRFDPAVIALAKKRVAAAKDNWAAVAGGDMHRAASLNEQFSLVGDSLTRLNAAGDLLAASLQAAVAPAANAGQVPSPALAMEVATAILYIDATIEDGELDHPELPARVRRLAKRIDDVRIGVEAQALEPWMEELYRRVSDRQTMGSVVQELRASLSEVEKQLDQYFRNPAERQVLIPVPAQLSAMRGVLSVLGLDQASAAVVHMRDDVDALANTEVDPQRARETGTFDRVADNLGTLGFLIDMLSVQPALAKSLFRFDAVTGNLSAVMGQAERPSAFLDLPGGAEAGDTESGGLTLAGELPTGGGFAPLTLEDYSLQVGSAALDPETGTTQLMRQLERLAQRALTAEQPGLARIAGDALDRLRRVSDDQQRRAVRTELARSLAGLAKPAREPLPPPPPAPRAAPPAGGTGLEEDDEMRDVFIEEAREVVADATAALERLADAPESPLEMTSVRRAFHTLKGSSRMVGLGEFGEAAWGCEQLYNARLAQAPRMDGPLREFTQEALGYLGGWVEAIAAGRDEGHRAAAISHAAEVLRLEGRRVAIPKPGAPAAYEPTVVMPRRPPPGSEVTTIALPRQALPDLGQEPAGAEPRTVTLPGRATPEPMAAFELPKTVALPPREVAPDSGFGFTLDLSEPAPAEAGPVVQRLTEQVPDLPKPADLELRARPKVPQLDVPVPTIALPPSALPAPDLAPAAPELGLPGDEAPTPPVDLDLPEVSELAELGGLPEPIEPTVRIAPVTPPLPPVPVLEMESFDLDLGGLDEAGAPSTALPEVDFETPSGPVPLDVPAGDVQALDIDADELERVFAAEPQPAPMPAEAGAADEQIKVIGPLRISIPLFNIFLNEADELSRRLVTELAEWGVESARHPVPESSVALAHSLAGNSGTVGYSALSMLARSLEHALTRSHAAGRGRRGEAALFADAADEIRRLLHQFAAGFLPPASPQLLERLAEHEHWPEAGAAGGVGGVPGVAVEVSDFLPLLGEPETAGPPSRLGGFDDEDDIDAEDAVDDELFPVFDEEAGELLPQLQGRLREWHDHPGDRDAAGACMRTLHTLKGGARLAGAMRLGEMAHRLETAIERLVVRGAVQADDIEPLLLRSDHMAAVLEALRSGEAAAGAPAATSVVPLPVATATPRAPSAVVVPLRPPHAAAPGAPMPAEAAPVPAPAPAPLPAAAEAPTLPFVAPRREPAAGEEPTVPTHALRRGPAAVPIDWQRFRAGAGALAAQVERAATGAAAVRVRSGLLDRLVSHAGEVSITRERIAGEMKLLAGSLGELTDSLERMRRQLRDIELQAETQIASRMETARSAGQSFDPLEMDRFTRLQELTRFMAESVADVATLQRTVQRTLQSTEDELAAQARLTRELQDDLLRTRMVEFESTSDRLYRTVRQAGKETGKAVRLDIVGGAIELDRGVLERMAGPFEHLLRNSVVHGIESAAQRTAAGKDPTGRVVVQVAQAGNEVAVEFGDDGGGFDYQRIRERAEERGLIEPGQPMGDAELAQLVFAPGFSTAEAVSELAGRGVGLDVVRAEVNAMGGRIETTSAKGQGTRFRLLLPLTTAVTQVVNLRCGEFQVAVPSTLVELVKRVPRADTEAAYTSGTLEFSGERIPFYWLAALLQAGTRGDTSARSQAVVVIRSAAQRVAVHVDEVVGNQEVVVKNVGPQLARLPGLVGVTLLSSGTVALIYNPVALAAVYADNARSRMTQPLRPVGPKSEQAAPTAAPLVLVVDDSLTVRRVTQRLLAREGYRVATAKDGLEALERLAEERPVVVLSDIEMPRMDGFDLVRNIRADERLADLAVIMITSRIAQKHREYAVELGVDHYLGKPYSEEELLGLVARYAHGETLV
jgi:chemosensory pili system protein ChpA (sensor histidine kinase/response regulator)